MYGSVSSVSRVVFRDYVSFSKTSSISGCFHFSTWSVFSVSSLKHGQMSEGQAPTIFIIFTVP